MRDRPEDLGDRELSRALGEWGIEAASLAYAPVGFGDHHWIAAADDDQKWFVTVADLELKGDQGPQAALRGLRRAMDTARALQLHHGLDFVVAPLSDTEGQTVRLLGTRYALSVFPFMDGETGDFDRPMTAPERGALMDLLAELHRQAPPAQVPVLQVRLPMRELLEEALQGALGWAGGPFAEPARALIGGHVPELRRRLEEFDRLAEEVKTRNAASVVTHGEPHPGNLLWQKDRYLLVDWDTVGLALPERDLWSIVQEPSDLTRYTEAGGRTPDPAALSLYSLRWDLEEVVVYLDWFRAPHQRSPDTEQAWDGLAESVQRLAE